MKNISKNSVIYLVYIIVNAILTFASSIYVAQRLFQADIGDILYTQNIAQYFAIGAMFGIPAYGVREIAKASNNINERCKIASECAVIQLISSLVFTCGYLTIVLCIPLFRNVLILYLIAGINIGINIINLSWLFEGLEQFIFISVRGICVKVFTFLLLLYFVKSPSDYIKYAVIVVFGTGMNYLINMCYASKCIEFSFRKLRLKRHMMPLIFLFVVSIVTEGYALIDTTLLGYYGTNIDVAIFSYANKIYLLLIEALNAITAVVVPKMAFYYGEKNKEKLSQTVSYAFNILFMIAVPLAIGTLYISKDMIMILYGEKYLESAYILMTMTPLLLITSFCYLLGTQVLLITGNEKKMLLAVLLGIIIKIIMDCLLIPLYGGIGVTISRIIGEIIIFVFSVYHTKQFFELIGTKKQIFRCVLSSLCMIVVLRFCKCFDSQVLVNVLLKILFAGITYFITFGVCIVYDKNIKGKKIS